MLRALFRSVLPTLGVATLAACSGGGSATAPAPGTSASWFAAYAAPVANAVVSAANPASAEQTFREIFKPSVGSRGTVRLHFSNAFGTSAVTLGAVHLATQSSGAAVTGDVPVTFSGSGSTSIAAGSSATSDPITYQYSYGAVLAVTEYVSGSWPALSQHSHLTLVTEYATPPGAGNATRDVAGTSFTQTTGDSFLFDRLDVSGNYKETVAVIGSSTTEGFGSTPNQFDDLVSDIAANLHAAGRDDTPVVNLAITPDSLLPKNDVLSNQSAIERFSRDVLTLPGIHTLVQNTADIDLKGATCSPASDIIAGQQSIVSLAHAAGIRILLALVAPTTFCDGQNPGGFGTRFPANTGQDAERRLLNAWIVSTQPSTVEGVAEAPPAADGYVDLSSVIADPANLAYPLPIYDTGDDSHLTPAGQALQAAAIPIGSL